MFQKKDIELNFDIIIGPHSMIKGDLESEGSIRIDGKVVGNITSQGNVIISENAHVIGDLKCLNTEIYGHCKGNVHVKGKLNLHQNASLDGDVISKSFSTKEGSHFNGQCTVDPNESLEIKVDLMLPDPKLVNISKAAKPLEDSSSEKESKQAK